MYGENEDNIELYTTNTKTMADEEYIFERYEEIAIKKCTKSAKSNVSNNNLAELTQTATPKNVKVSETKRKTGSSSFKENEDRTQEIFKMVKSINESLKERNEKNNDDFDAFGDIVARKLRSLRTHYAQCTIQHSINNLLYDGELGKYDIPLQTFFFFN